MQSRCGMQTESGCRMPCCLTNTGPSAGRFSRSSSHRRETTSGEFLNETFELSEIAAFVDAIGEIAVFANDRVASIPVRLRFRVQPVHVPSFHSHLFDDPGLACVVVVSSITE